MYWNIITIFLLAMTRVEGDKISKGYIVLESSSLNLTCTVGKEDNSRWKWFYRKKLEDQEMWQCNFENEDGRCEKTSGNNITVVSTPTASSLVIPSISMRMTGNYDCLDDDALAETEYSVLVVGDISILHKDTRTNDGIIDVVRGDSLNGSCEVTYDSSRGLRPSVLVTDTGEDDVTYEPNLVKSTFDINATESFNLTCTVAPGKFKDSVLVAQVEIRTHHCPERIEFLGHTNHVVHKKEKLICKVSAHPPVNVSFLHPQSINGSNEAILPIDTKGNYICVVSDSNSELLGDCGGLKEKFTVKNVSEHIPGVVKDQKKPGCTKCRVKSGQSVQRPNMWSIIIGCFIFRSFYWPK